jgi:hypothetical protein
MTLTPQNPRASLAGVAANTYTTATTRQLAEAAGALLDGLDRRLARVEQHLSPKPLGDLIADLAGRAATSVTVEQDGTIIVRGSGEPPSRVIASVTVDPGGPIAQEVVLDHPGTVSTSLGPVDDPDDAVPPGYPRRSGFRSDGTPNRGADVWNPARGCFDPPGEDHGNHAAAESVHAALDAMAVRPLGTFSPGADPWANHENLVICLRSIHVALGGSPHVPPSTVVEAARDLSAQYEKTRAELEDFREAARRRPPNPWEDVDLLQAALQRVRDTVDSSAPALEPAHVADLVEGTASRSRARAEELERLQAAWSRLRAIFGWDDGTDVLASARALESVRSALAVALCPRFGERLDHAVRRVLDGAKKARDKAVEVEQANIRQNDTIQETRRILGAAGDETIQDCAVRYVTALRKATKRPARKPAPKHESPTRIATRLAKTKPRAR